MQRVSSPVSPFPTIGVALSAALLVIACGSAEGGLDASSRPATTAVPAPGRTANGQPILPATSSPAPTPAAATPPLEQATEALNPAEVVFDPSADAGSRPAPEARPAPSTPPAAATPSPPPVNGGEEDVGEDDDEEEEEEDED